MKKVSKKEKIVFQMKNFGNLFIFLMKTLKKLLNLGMILIIKIGIIYRMLILYNYFKTMC